jgi:hypothetical protein
MSRPLLLGFLALIAALSALGCADKCEQAAAQHCAGKTDEEFVYIYGKIDGSREACVAEYVSEMCISGRGER